jgi:hypothetical protein
LTVSVASLLVPLALALIFAVFVRLTLRVLIVNVLLVCPVLIVTLPSEPESSGYQFLIVRAILSRSFASASSRFHRQQSFSHMIEFEQE